jgi:hypothetical protein
MILRAATSLLGALEGVGPKNLDFFGPKWHSLCSGHFRGSKKSQFSGPTPSNATLNDVARLKTIMYHAIKTTGTLIVQMNDLQLLVAYRTESISQRRKIQSKETMRVFR